MPRPPRAILAGQPIHLVQRGNNRVACFAGDRDRRFYLRALLEVSRRAGCAIHAYALMTNHVHLLVTASNARAPSRMMQALGGRYVRYFNDRVERSGTLWEGRFRSSLIDSERYFLACSRYIETNPVRAGIVTHPEHYRWSSYLCNAHGRDDALVTPHAVYTALGGSAAMRRKSYEALFSRPVETDDLHRIRRAIKAQTVLGSTRFRESLEAKLRRPLTRASHGGDRRSGRSLGKVSSD